MLGRQICRAELLVPEPSPSEAEIPTAKSKKYKSTIHQIPAELIQERGSEICKLINSIWKKEELPINFIQNCIQYPPRLSPYQIKLLGNISVGFHVTDQLLTRFFAFVRY
jgi:hypothetical protein